MSHLRLLVAASSCAVFSTAPMTSAAVDAETATSAESPSQVDWPSLTGDRDSDLGEMIEIDPEYRTEVRPFACGHAPSDLSGDGLTLAAGKALGWPQFPSELFPDGTALFLPQSSPLWNDLCRSTGSGDLANSLGLGHVLSSAAGSGVAGVPSPGAAMLLLIAFAGRTRRNR